MYIFRFVVFFFFWKINFPISQNDIKVFPYTNLMEIMKMYYTIMEIIQIMTEKYPVNWNKRTFLIQFNGIYENGPFNV